jgi:hypothetical protein
VSPYKRTAAPQPPEKNEAEGKRKKKKTEAKIRRCPRPALIPKEDPHYCAEHFVGVLCAECGFKRKIHLVRIPFLQFIELCTTYTGEVWST